MTNLRSVEHHHQPIMRTSELALIAAAMLGCIFKILHWPGAALLLVFGGGSLALLYFPFGWRTLPAPKPTDQLLWMTLLGGSAACTAIGGILAFLQHWPYSATVMWIGALACGVTLVTSVIVRYRRTSLDLYLDGLMIRCAVLGGLAFTLWELFAGRPH